MWEIENFDRVERDNEFWERANKEMKKKNKNYGAEEKVKIQNRLEVEEMNL